MTNELDELKQSWRELESQVQRHMAQQSEREQLRLHSERLQMASRSLSPLYWGQIALIGFGCFMILLGVGYWRANWHEPHRMFCGVLLHIYGVVVIALAGIALGKMKGIDYTLPVTVIQQRLRQLRRWYTMSGAMVGLPWWLLWLVLVQVVLGYLGVDFLGQSSPTFVILNVGVGCLGLIGTWLFHRWLHQPGREKLAQQFDDQAAGKSILRAERQLADLTEGHD